MPDVKVSPVLPISASAPVAANSASGAQASQPNQDQQAFSQVLRDKQTANADAAKAAVPDTGKPESAAKTDPSTAPGKEAADAASSDETKDASAPRTPAELAQLLAAAGLMAAANNTPTATDAAAEGTAADATQVSGDAAADAALALAASATDKSAGDTAKPAASLAAGAANPAASTKTEEQLLAQAQLANGKGEQTRSAQTGDASSQQQPQEKDAVAALTNKDAADKSRAAGKAEESFTAALDRVTQASEASRTAAPVASNVSSTQAAQAPAVAHQISTPVGRTGWADEVGQGVLWTAKSDSSRADLILTPAHLGRIEVSIQMNGDQANASFVAANPVAREALQDAMPRLRELMAQAGIQLGQADVGAGQSGQNSANGGQRPGARQGGGMLGGDGAIGAVAAGSWRSGGTGLVDTFA